MLTASFITVLSTLLVTVHAQNAQLETESIQAQFTNAHLVPDLIPSFDPVGFLTVNFGTSDVDPGTLLQVADVQNSPTITATPANSSAQFGDLFTLAMVDPGSVDAPSNTPTRHWLVNGVTIGSDGKVTVPENATTITAYGAPLPPAADAPHRYAIILWNQPSTFTAPADPAAGSAVGSFSLSSYVQAANLGPVVAGWYFTCTTGTATASLVTSSVNTATLPAATQGSGSGSSSGTASSPSSSATHSTGAAASTAVVGPVAVLASVVAAFFGIMA